MTIQAHLDKIQAKTGNSPEAFQALAAERGLTTFRDVKAWLKSAYGPVSYTHLDVYKRQPLACRAISQVWPIPTSATCGGHSVLILIFCWALHLSTCQHKAAHPHRFCQFVNNILGVAPVLLIVTH